MIAKSVEIFVCVLPQDMRRGFDGLARAVEETLGHDPRSGAMYCFVNRRCNRLKVLWWDGNGYCVLYKRVHDHVFVLPGPPRGRMAIRIERRRLAKLIAGTPRAVARMKA